MAYTDPTVGASSQTFAQLQTLGAQGFVQGVGTVATLTAAQTEILGQLLHPVKAAKPAERLRNIIDTYLQGDPVVIATLEAELVDLQAAYLAMANGIGEIGDLVDANQGSLAPAGTTTGIGMGGSRRTFS